MNGVEVTLKSNVEFDEEGGIIYNDAGDIQLKDENDVGVITKTHVVPMSQVDAAGNILAGFISRCEIYWDLRRSPAPDMVDPSDLVWLSMFEDNTDDDDDDDGPEGDDGEDVLEPEFEEAV